MISDSGKLSLEPHFVSARHIDAQDLETTARTPDDYEHGPWAQETLINCEPRSQARVDRDWSNCLH